MKKWMSSLAVATALFFVSGHAEETTRSEGFKLLDMMSHHHHSSSHHHTSPFETSLNKYKLLLTVGMDELLPSPPVTPGLQGFRDILGWDDTRIEKFRQATISYFNERFGVDFSGGSYDPNTGITSISYAILLPVTFTGNYRVLASNNSKIPATPVDHPPYIRAFEFVCIFNENAAGHFYTGTYANAGPVAINPSDTLDFGIYRIFVQDKQGHDKKHYDFYARVYYPNRTEPVNATPPRINETFQLYSTKFGPGAGFLNVAIPLAPNQQGLFPTFIRGTWSFPGSFVLPDLNTFSESPI